MGRLQISEALPGPKYAEASNIFTSITFYISTHLVGKVDVSLDHHGLELLEVIHGQNRRQHEVVQLLVHRGGYDLHTTHTIFL